MTTAFLFGLYSTSALIIGCLLGLWLKISRKILAHIMAFGAGVLIAALTFDLMEEAYSKGGFDSVSFGFIGGAIIFILGDYLIDKYGGQHRKSAHAMHSKSNALSSGKAIAFGAFLDGIPESIAIGAGLTINAKIGTLLVLAVFISNIPEVLSSVESLKSTGMQKIKIFMIWFAIAVLSILAVVLGYKFLVNALPDLIAVIMAIAAGGILAMVVDTMLPDSYREGGNMIALAASFGFLSSFILSHLIK